jgi:putative flippase GtrA
MITDALTRQAITHTRHCLTGCGIGEVLGMALGQNLSNIAQTGLAVVLAFIVGYGLTFRGAIRKMSARDAIKLALAVDTVSIISMEIIDNVSEWLIPGAINARLHNILFWWSLALSLAIAFIVTVPVNRYLMSRGLGGHSGHGHQ